MSRDAHDIIAYLQQAMRNEQEDVSGVVITEMAASNIIAELQSLMTDIAQARIDIGELLTENRRLEEALDDKD